MTGGNLQLFAAAGRLEQAEEVARSFLAAAPNDADAHALSLLLLHRRRAADVQAMAEAYVGLLREDPYSEAAVEGLMRLHQDSGLGGPLLVEGICLFLDTQGTAQDADCRSQLQVPIAGPNHADFDADLKSQDADCRVLQTLGIRTPP
jgi:hypothetical protein